MAPIAAPVRKDTLEKESRAKVKLDINLKKKKQNNCSSLIIALLSDKLAEEFFFSLFSYPLQIYCVHRY